MCLEGAAMEAFHVPRSVQRRVLCSLTHIQYLSSLFEQLCVVLGSAFAQTHSDIAAEADEREDCQHE